LSSEEEAKTVVNSQYRNLFSHAEIICYNRLYLQFAACDLPRELNFVVANAANSILVMGHRDSVALRIGRDCCWQTMPRDERKKPVNNSSQDAGRMLL
jgi:hypothetical protein